MKKMKNQTIPFNLVKYSLILTVISAIAIAVIGVNAANAVEDQDLVAKCSKLGKDYAGEDTASLGNNYQLFQKCIYHGLCETEKYKLKDCNKADELHKKYLNQKKQGDKKKQDDDDKAQAKICVKWDGQTYVESVMRKCDKPDTLCAVKKDGHLDCAKAKKLAGISSEPSGDSSSGDSSSSGSTSSGDSSGGEGTKNPDRADEPLSGDGIGSEATGDFLGFPSWNRDVYFKPGRQIGPQIMKIVLNITEILLRLAGIAAVIVIIYAGAMFIIGSYSASPDGIAKAKTILINGVIGLIIAIAATAIITFIVGSLKGK